ncbi:MAG: methylenetetrahydrofolate--tRNA-(uracil(54)-C(5))-methyltransferase (FADH(2)-oxidizing) TrmFO [Anaerolineae bacterium]|nr:methylenetetrahydrofolate--tRNA-(uracil(54)-C(5))-methyltransferase (FADH(2)-oxidizing) TrmFO [Anaerolineae bacterium]
MEKLVTVVGGGLAGCEAAWQAARLGAPVVLYEMRPQTMTPAHTGGDLGELVCSNSLGSNIVGRAPGLLKEELRRLGSLVIAAADAHRLPAGSALAVDRGAFAATLTALIRSHPSITLIRQEVTRIPDTDSGPVVLATGPLTSPPLAQALQALGGQANLFFYDAIAPIVELDSIDLSIAFRASRYGKGESDEGDYINCPMTEAEYDVFYDALLSAERIKLRDFERPLPREPSEGPESDSAAAQFFEGCLPIEVLAARGKKALAFGPLRPVGLTDPRSASERPASERLASERLASDRPKRRLHAVVQLRQDNAAGTLYNLVGFQTNLKYGEQDRVLRLIPGLAHARFVRYGSMHRNTYVNAPALLLPTLQMRAASECRALSEVPGTWASDDRVGATNLLLAGVNAARILHGESPLTMPPETMIGALIRYITHAEARGFQPMKANFGLMPPLESPLPKNMRGKRSRGEAYAERALAALADWLTEHPLQAVRIDV